MGIPQARPVIEQMRRAALRLMLVVGFLNALILSAVALLASAAGDLAWTTLVAAVALGLAAWPMSYPEQLEERLSRAPWLPVAAGALGGLMLALDPSVRGTLFPAFLTPIGVCALFAYWRQALLAAVLVVGGYLLGDAQPGVHGSLEATLSDILAVFEVMAGALVPARIAFSAIERRRDTVDAWRADAGDAAQLSAPGSPGISREHDAAVLAGVQAGRSDKAIAVELGMGKASWRVRDRRQRLQREYGVGDRRGLATLLHDSAAGGGS
jgi:hypothetical protein